VASFVPENYPEYRDPLTDAAINAALWGVEAFVTKGVGKLLNKVEAYIHPATNKVGDVVKVAKGEAEALAATRASVDDKLTSYLLNAEHPVGGSKAKWFDSALGFNPSNADQLAKQIAFNEASAVQTAVTQHGIQFNQVIPITGANGRVIDVTFGWIRNNDGIVRLVTAIPTKK
jgi:filamentous hemagglutinin